MSYAPCPQQCAEANFSVSAITRILAAIQSDFVEDFVEARKGGGGPKKGSNRAQHCSFSDEAMLEAPRPAKQAGPALQQAAAIGPHQHLLAVALRRHAAVTARRAPATPSAAPAAPCTTETTRAHGTLHWSDTPRELPPLTHQRTARTVSYTHLTLPTTPYV